MNKFKVGDKVKGTNSLYTMTDERMAEGVVTYVFDDNFIRVMILKHEVKEFTGRSYSVEAKYFKPMEQKPATRIIKVGKAKFIFNPPYTIVTDGTHTGKAKCNPAEEYDPITGLEIAKKRFEEAKFPDKSGELLKEVEKAVEPEFKVGDEVEIVGSNYHQFKNGSIGVIKAVTAWKSFIVSVDGMEQFIHPAELKLIKEEKLKVGDRVEMIKTRGYSFDKVGNIGTVTRVSGNRAEINVDNSYEHLKNWGYIDVCRHWKKICTK